MKRINPVNNRGSIRIRFTLHGKVYNFSPIDNGRFDDENDLTRARGVCAKIELDIRANNFDTSLERYKSDNRQVLKAIEVVPVEITHLLEIWQKFGEDGKRDDYHFRYTQKSIEKFNPLVNDTQWLNRSGLSAATIRVRLSIVKQCYIWALSQKLISVNPYEKSLKILGKKSKPIIPFTKDELNLILSHFESIYPHYYHFIKFLTLTGTRLSEAIGLTWEKVDLKTGRIIIDQSLTIDRSQDGNSYHRIKKGTKTENSRVLILTDELNDLFESMKRGKPSDLVFTTINSHTIDDGNFRDRCWKPALKSLGITYRKLHILRHTFLSHLLDRGKPVTQVAYIAGHKNTRMVVETYGHIVEIPKLDNII
jgi:integrase